MSFMLLYVFDMFHIPGIYGMYVCVYVCGRYISNNV